MQRRQNIYTHCMPRIVTLAASSWATGNRSWSVRVAKPRCRARHRKRHCGVGAGAPGSRACPSAWACPRVSLHLPSCPGSHSGRRQWSLWRPPYEMHAEGSDDKQLWSWLAQGLLRRFFQTRLHMTCCHTCLDPFGMRPSVSTACASW